MNDSQCLNISNASLEYSQCLDNAVYSICPDISLCRPQTGANVGLAFGLTIGAGLATTLGALLPFIPFIKRSNTRFLAIGLGLATGVMLYVSFTEIWKKSRDNFCCVTQDHFDLAVTACFFGGVLITILLDLFVSILQKINCGNVCCCLYSGKGRKEAGPSSLSLTSLCRCHKTMNVHGGTLNATNTLQLDKVSSNGVLKDRSTVASSQSSSVSEMHQCVVDFHANTPIPSIAVVSQHHHDPGLSNGSGVPADVGTSSCEGDHYPADGVSISVNSNALSENTNNYATVSVNELFSNTSLQRMNATIPDTTSACVEEKESKDYRRDEMTYESHCIIEGVDAPSENGIIQQQMSSYGEMSEDSSIEPLGPKEFQEVTEGLGKSTKKLHKMGILTGIAIGIHNFPEGLATFVAALSSPSLGAALAVAIALHNIPEGVCVAMPVYYATGKKWKGFMWAFLSGISEPFGALLGWLVLKDVFGPLVYGVAFGLISGMMVFISLKELLPTALRFDNTKGRVVSICIVIGMLVMAISLLLFLY